MSPRKSVSPSPIGNYIMRRRKHRGWSTAELARQANLSYSTVRNIEKGMSRKPSEAILRTLSAALECDEGVVFAYAGYGVIPEASQEEIDALFAELGDEAPLWRDTIERIKQEMTPAQQSQALAVLRAQLDVASRHWSDRQ